MSQTYTVDPLWQKLEGLLGPIPGDFRLHYDKHKFAAHLRKNRDWSEAKSKRAINGLGELLALWGHLMGQDRVSNRLFGTPSPSRQDKQRKQPLNDQNDFRLVTDPSAAISSLLAAQAMESYGNAKTAALDPLSTYLRQVRNRPKLRDISTFLNEVARIENHLEADGNGEAAAKDDISDPQFREILAESALTIHEAINKTFDEVPEQLHTQFLKVDFDWQHQGAWRTIRATKNWMQSDADVIAYSSSCNYLCALDRLCKVLSAHYSWTQEHALLFVLHHAAPPPGTIRVRYAMRYDIPRLSRIVLEIEPSVPIDTVRQVFERAREFALKLPDRPQSYRKPKTVSTKHLTLAVFVYSHFPNGPKNDLDWRELMEEWNDEIVPILQQDPSSSSDPATPGVSPAYSSKSHFQRDAVAAREKILSPKYRDIHFDHLFIAGESLPALSILDRNETTLSEAKSSDASTKLTKSPEGTASTQATEESKALNRVVDTYRKAKQFQNKNQQESTRELWQRIARFQAANNGAQEIDFYKKLANELKKRMGTQQLQDLSPGPEGS